MTTLIKSTEVDWLPHKTDYEYLSPEGRIKAMLLDIKVFKGTWRSMKHKAAWTALKHSRFMTKDRVIIAVVGEEQELFEVAANPGEFGIGWDY